jgi:hypothetical protein
MWQVIIVEYLPLRIWVACNAKTRAAANQGTLVCVDDGAKLSVACRVNMLEYNMTDLAC